MARSIAPPEAEDRRYRAVRERDARADGRFFYAVATTGVFCRPSCGARLPRPENVRYFATLDAARAAGFRPCKRCRPDAPTRGDRDAGRVAAACRTLETAESPPALAELAGAAGLSPFYFHRLFKSVTGLTPRAYASAKRAERVRAELAAPVARRRGVTDAIYAAGYNSSARFYAEAGALLGMPPRTFGAGGAGETIRHATGRSSLGLVLVAATDRGICAVFLGDDARALERDLEARFPRARLEAAPASFARQVATVVATIEHPEKGLALPLDVRGTAFQARVWRALQEIPAGATMTYTELAAKLGTPRAVRAVAGAIAANPVGVAIPCHRVIRADGSLAGYRWGIERKRTLLARERDSRRDGRR